MKNKILSAFAVCATSVLLFSSCSNDPYVITSEEAYTRAFLKKFGLIDTEHDWNMAQSANVTVDVGSGAKSVKVYAKVNDAYYGVATLKNISGEMVIPVDVPEGTDELKVEVDDRTYYCAVGGKVDVNNPASRTTITHDHATTPVLGSRGDAAVSVGDTYYEFDMDVINTIVGSTGVLPEEEDNYEKENITTNFSIKYTGPFTFYPVYFHTGAVHELGVYWLTDQNDPDKVKVVVGPGEDGVYGSEWDEYHAADDEYIYIKKQPVYRDKVGSEMQWYDSSCNYQFSWETTPYNSPKRNSRDSEDDNSDYTLDNGYYYPGNANSGSTWNGSAHVKYVCLSSWTNNNFVCTVPNFVPTADQQTYKDMIHSSTGLTNYFNTNKLYAYGDGSVDGGVNILTNCTTAQKADILGVINTFLAGYPGWEFYEAESAVTSYGKDNYTFYMIFRKPVSGGGESGGGESGGDEPGETVLYWHDYVAPDAKEQRGMTAPLANQDTEGATHTVPVKADAEKMRALPITVDLGNVANGDPNFKFGFYIDVYPDDDIDFSGNEATKGSFYHTIYSNAKLNVSYANGSASDYALAAKYKTTVGDDERTFFSFEDWSLGKIDLNDLIFMVKTSADDDDDDFVPPTFVDEDDPEEPEPTVNTLSWLVATEDLGAFDDFDFNDVVFQLQSVTTTDANSQITKSVKVQALAAGGTLETYLHYSDGTNDYILGPNNKILDNTGNDGTTPPSGYEACEWHRWFGSVALDMINTGRGADVPTPGQCDISSLVDIDFSVENYSQLDQQMYDWGGYHTSVHGFYITVGTTAAGSTMDKVEDSNNERRIGADITPGKAPQMFLIPDIGHIRGKGWYWPEERYYIVDTYPAFGSWISNQQKYNWHSTVGEGYDTHVKRPAVGLNNGTPY